MKKIPSRSILGACLFFVVSSSQAQTPRIIYNELESFITQEFGKAHFEVGSAALQAKDLIGEWMKANKTLIDTAFDGLDQSTRQMFASTSALIKNTNGATNARIQQANELMILLAQISTTAQLSKTYVLSHSPHVFPPTATSRLTLTVRGVNIDYADPSIEISPGIFLPGQHPNQTELLFNVPAEPFENKGDRPIIHTLKLHYRTAAQGVFDRLLGKKEPMTMDLSIVSLPAILGRYKVETEEKTLRRIDNWVTWNLGQYKGRHTRSKVIVPPNHDGDALRDWIWDLGFRHNAIQGPGEAGNVVGIDPVETSPSGLVVVLNFDAITNIKYPFGADGYVNVSIEGLRYRTEEEIVRTKTPESTFGWNGDVKIATAPHANVTITVNTFDGRERIIQDTDTDRFFDVKRVADGLILSPKVPEDIR